MSKEDGSTIERDIILGEKVSERSSLFLDKYQGFVGDKDGFTGSEAAKFGLGAASLPFQAVGFIYLGIAWMMAKALEYATAYKDRKNKRHAPFAPVASFIGNMIMGGLAFDARASRDVLVGVMEEVDGIYNNLLPGGKQQQYLSYFEKMMGKWKKDDKIPGPWPSHCGASSLDGQYLQQPAPGYVPPVGGGFNFRG